jgi:hypothetical protein
MKVDEKDKVSNIEDLWIDIGAKDRDAATKRGRVRRRSRCHRCAGGGAGRRSHRQPFNRQSHRRVGRARGAADPVEEEVEGDGRRSRGSTTNARLAEVAEQEKIPFTLIAAPRFTATDAHAIYLSRHGVATAVLSVPNR